MSSTTPTRPTQADRRARTISRALDATLDSLVENGYAGTTMRGVAQRIGVSQGAITHHFPERLDLIAAAIGELAERQISALRSRIQSLPRDRAARRREGLDLMRYGFHGPLFVAWVRLWVAAAEDDELRERMRPVEKRLWRLIRETVAEALPEFAEDPAFDDRLAVALSTLRGLGMQEHFDPLRDERRGDLWPLYRTSLELLFTTPVQSRRRS